MKPDPASAERLALRLGALSHPARLEILTHLADADCCCCKDVVGRLDLAQSTVSQHLKVLVEAGLVRVRQERQRSIYEIDRGALADTASRVTALADACCPPQAAGCAEPRVLSLG
ncbi:metalloregulator ArsR/SmtB family transcription factor [Mesorhizobium sp. LHD-90]|uniref:ArsR/SmtB family transcription factor n=1 Tax=Mesorhizobium sp. LHD-90 TaxID=3071414 RepID=UPI0027DFC998|nr:metalloregulator ArsR/SmtB family transcription factor [Mesorhizobium sp. LHD-90]MDQ6435134.1 metalloregulator ArsR/SmtB family transcription factor [Mesorhizobium sp. LHD-90]